MASIFRRGKKFAIEYTDERNVRRRRVGFTDRRLTQTLANQIEREVAERRAGVLPPGSPAHKKFRDEQVDTAVDDYAADLARSGRGEAYRLDKAKRIKAVAAAAKWKTLADIDAQGLTTFLARFAAGKAPRTVNEYRDHVAQFCNWLVEQGRLAANPVARVKRSKVRDTRHRRAFTTDELLRLVSVCSPNARRAFLLAAFSGLRRGELRKLEARDVNTTTAPWRWRLRPEATKAGRAEDLPMLPEAEELLRELAPDKMKPTERLLPVPDWKVLSRALRRAGIAKHDASGRHLDFHSLRYTFCTVLAKTLPIQVVKLLMRHKDINLTARVYMDLGVEDVAAEVLKLPRLFPKPDGEKK